METDTKIFKYLDRAFWMVWGALPFLVCIRLYYAFTFAYFNTEGQEIPLMEFSLAGKVLACSFLSVGLIFYVLLLGFMHALIRQFQRGSLFVERTLQCMKRIAVVLIGWPFMMLVLFNVTQYGLFRLGDLQEWKPEYDFDLPLIAAGLVILALRLVISHAIELHRDAQYTV